MINLPDRADKLDLFSLVSSVSGFNLDTLEGVKGENMNNKTLSALENLPEDPKRRNNVVGCWRVLVHVNSAQTIVINKLTSALAMENNSDWDTHLKDQLHLFAHGSQFVTGNPSGTMPHSPYGDDWDLLWHDHGG